MNKHLKRLAFKNRVMRIITLISFFHLSGLNNGFTQVVLIGGQVEGFNFAPVAIGKVAHVMNPTLWKRTVLDGGWKNTIYGSGKIIEYSSQRAVTRMLTEGNLFQMWVVKSLSNKFMSGTAFFRSGTGEVEKGFKKTLSLEPSLRRAQRLFKTLFDLPPNSQKSITTHKQSRYLDILKQQYWDKMVMAKGEGNWNSQQILNVREGKIALAHMGIGVESLKFKGVGYHRTRAGGESAFNFMNQKIKNVPNTIRDVFFFGGRP